MGLFFPRVEPSVFIAGALIVDKQLKWPNNHTDQCDYDVN